MTTQTMNNFETLDLETLANAEGGGCSVLTPKS
nr:ComC/BlpC family leader-containing pheromone/bacteriocin [Streptococcus salivarius]